MNTDMRLNEANNYHMHSVEALLAGTLALMSAHAQCSCPQSISNKDMMTKKIIANLSQLISHANLTEQFRMVLGNLHKMWSEFDAVQRSSGHIAPQSRTQELWHHAPAVVQ